MKKVVNIIGARPQFIKASVVSREIRRMEGLEEIIIHTGQHFDSNMSDIFFSEMEIPRPNINLGINDKSEGAMLGEMVIALDAVFEDQKPDCVIIYGDTTSTLAGAIAASKRNLPLAHIEAGMRSNNRGMPEEINRILSDHASDYLFCSTKEAVSNLLKEGVNPEERKIVLSGDVMYDAFLYYLSKIEAKPNAEIKNLIGDGDYALLTLHRQANVDDLNMLNKIWSAIASLKNRTRIVFPCHPRTRKNIESLNTIENVEIIDPVGYLDMLNLLTNCSLVLTDSGGLQKEAYFAKKFCITLRNETEWTELVEEGFNLLAGNRLDELDTVYDELKTRVWVDKDDLYGHGNASKLIVEELMKFL